MTPRRWNGAAAVALCLLCVAGRAEDLSPDARVADFLAWERAEWMRAADTAEKKGYVTLARRCVAQITRRDSGAAEDEGADTRLAALREADDGAKLNAKTRASLERAVAKVRKSVAAKAASLATALKNADDDRAPELAALALRNDPASAAARGVLGHTRTKGWGWLDATDAARLKAGEVPVGDGWRPKKGLRRDPRPWGEQWTVTSDHFRIRSNLALPRVFALRDLLEMLRDRFLADWEGTLPMVPEESRHDVFIFAQKSEYDTFLKANDPTHIKGVPGQYSPTHRRATFFDVETLRAAGGQTSSLEELMLHECAHQLFYELVAIRATAIDSNDSPNAWINEGLAEFYGMHSRGKGVLVLDRKAIRGMLRTIQVKKSASLVPSASALTAMTKGVFQSPDGERRVTNYATAGFFALFLSEGATRGAWQRVVREFFCNGNSPDAFAGSMGDFAKRMDESFRKFLAKL